MDQLSCHMLSLHVDIEIEPSKHNLRMAKGMKCLHAIYYYMRTVKLKYHVHPAPALHIKIVYSMCHGSTCYMLSHLHSVFKAGARGLVHAWFLEIVFVYTSVCVCIRP